MLASVLAGQLDSTSDLHTRTVALAELARDGQPKVNRFFLRRTVADPDDREDLCASVWEVVTRKIFAGEFDASKCQVAMGFVYGIASQVLKHYRTRDRRLLGQVVTLDEHLDIGEACADLVAIEDALERESRYQRLLTLLDEDGREVARRIWTDGYDPHAIANGMGRNIKTVRGRIRQIAEHLQTIRAEE